MTGRTARFALPFILPGQAQKELFHNEAIAALDGLVHAAVEGGASVPPDEPTDGESWLVEAGGSGAWTGHDHALACFTSGGWRFVAPIDGMSVWDKSAGLSRRWLTGAWTDGTINVAAVEIDGLRVVGARQPDITAPVGGAVVDAEARAAIDAVIVTLKSHGLID